MDEKKDSLVVIWTTDNKVTALNMVFMYTTNAKVKGWWKDVTLVIWGASSEALVRDPELQIGIRKMMEAGVYVEACKACADNLGVSEDLESFGITVRYVGEPLTEYMKEGRHVLTF